MIRGNGTVCLCRHAFNLRSSTNSAKRFASSRHREPYVLPRLVIDLDAANSKYVRQAEELEGWYPKRSERQPNSKPLRTNQKRPLPLPLLKQVTPPDLLAFALLGDPGGSWKWETHGLRGIYRYRKIEADHSIYSKALQLTSNFRYDPEQRFEFREAKWAAYRWQLHSCAERGGYPELLQMVSLLSTTKEGCRFLAKEGQSLFDGIRNCRRFQMDDRPQAIVSAEKVLQLYNNLRINMDSKEIEFGPELCSSALYYAAKEWNMPSIRTYLELLPPAPIYKAIVSSITSGALKALVTRLLYEPERAAGPLGSETLKLITGWDSHKTSVTHARNATSIVYFLRNFGGPVASSLYLAGLAELKLNDTLFAEWEADSENSIGTRLWKQNSSLRAQMFALAFHLAGDSSHALSVLGSMIAVDGDDAAPYTDEDDLGERSPGASRKRTESPVLEDGPTEPEPLKSRRVRVLEIFFYAHYNYHNVDVSDSLNKVLIAALRELPDDPQQFLDMAEKFFIRDYRAPIKPREPQKKLHWVDESGIQGLLIRPDEGDVPIYWKPASQDVV